MNELDQPAELANELQAPEAPVRRAALIFIFITVVLDILALGLIIPVLPKLVLQFSNGNTENAAAIYGLFVTVWAAMQFVCSPVLGALSDRFGRRPVILLSNVGLGFDYILMALAPGFTLLFIGRVISGICASSISAASAYIADVTPHEKRAAGYGMLGAAFGLGFVIGPALGGILGHYDLRLPFWVAAGLSLANATYGFFILPESLKKENRAKFQWRRANPFGSLKFLSSHANLLGLAMVAFCSNFAHVVFPACFVLYAGYRYGWEERKVGLVLALAGVCSSVVQGGLIRPLIKRLGERMTLMIGLGFGVAGFTMYGFAPNGTVFTLAIPVMAMWGLAGPSVQALMTKKLGPDEQGRLQGALTSLNGVANMAGPPIFSGIFALFISTQAPMHLPGAPFLLATLVMIIAMPLAWRYAKSVEQPNPL
ncbi:MAG: TCR/Tet family MFS transporter [Candidatus Sumerlaeaceae bacterium]